MSLGSQEGRSKKDEMREECYCSAMKTLHCQVLKSHLNAAFPLPRPPRHTKDRIQPLWQRKAERLGRLEDCSVINTYTIGFRPFSSFHMRYLGTSSLAL